MDELSQRVQAALGARYQVEGVAATGGMSTILRAVDLKHDRIVAVKVFHAEVAGYVGTDRFLREIRLIARLQHPHIVPLFDSGAADGLLYYTMPFIEGETLRTRLQRDGFLPVETALDIAREVCDALAYAHAHDILHRDVKPENILLADGHALLSDFGIARALDAAAMTHTTGTGFVLGTPAYMSPEQASGERELDARSDLYSLGCVLYEMLAGAAPYTAPNAQALLAERFRSLPKPLRVVRAEIPVRVERAVARVLSLAPEERFGSAAAFAAELVPTGEHSPVTVATRGSRLRMTAAAIAVAGIATIAFLNRDPNATTLDPSLYVVLPLARTDAATGASWEGDDCARLLFDAIARWKGVRLVDEMRTRDAVQLAGGRITTLSDAIRVAQRLGAGRLVWGSIVRSGSGEEVRAVVYDVASPSAPPLARQISVLSSGGDVADVFSSLADSLVLRSALDRGAPQAGRSRNLEAVRAYLEGQRALDAWDLAAARDAFLRATSLDSGYAEAHLWVAQVAMWLPDSRGPPTSAHAAAALAKGLPAGLQPRARALLAMSRNDLVQACAQYDSMLASDSSNFIAWYGRGDCLSQDRMVVADRFSPSGWRFRSSRHAGVEAYRRALALIPSFQNVYGAAALMRLERLLLASPNTYLRGYRLNPDTVEYGARPALVADTLSAVPWPFPEFAHGQALARPPSYRAALDRNRGVLAQLAQRWATDAPGNPRAQEAFALALEGLARIDTVRGVPSALDQMQRARALATDRAAALHVDLISLRLHLKLGRWGEAKRLADALLAAADTLTPVDQRMLSAVALLTGRVALAQRLANLTADRDSLFTPRGSRSMPIGLAAPFHALTAFAITGGPADSTRFHRERLQRAIGQFVNASDAPFVDQMLLAQVLMFAYPETGPTTEHASPGFNTFLRAEAAHARGDIAALRAAIAEIDEESDNIRPADAGPEFVYLLEWLRRASGDSATALAHVSRYLTSLTATSRDLFLHDTGGAGLIRLLMLHAELAWASGDRAAARRSADAVLTLWNDCDGSLAPHVARMQVYRGP